MAILVTPEVTGESPHSWPPIFIAGTQVSIERYYVIILFIILKSYKNYHGFVQCSKYIIMMMIF